MLAILVIGKSFADDDLKIDAAEIKGLTGTEVQAKDAVLSYGDITLRSAKILYDTQAGWIKASEGVRVEDGRGNVLETRLLDYFPQIGSAVAEGNVRVVANSGVSLWANLIRFEIESQLLFVEGEGRLIDDRGNKVAASTMRYLIEERTGSATDIVITSDSAVGTIMAASLELHPEGYSLSDASYTTCKVDDPAWILEAGSVEIDKNNQVTTRNTTLRFFGVPVAYFPTMTFNFSKERRSGFLAPRTSFRSGGQVNIEFPFYLNLAPNYDATITPRFINERGVLTDFQGRWLLPNTHGTGGIKYIKDETDEKSRWSWNIDNRTSLENGFDIDLSGQWISDDFFADDFFEGNLSSKRHYEQRLEIGRRDKDVAYGVEFLRHKTIDETDPGVTRPFDSLPAAWVEWNSFEDDYDLMVEGRVDQFVRGENDPGEGYRIHTMAHAGLTDWFGAGQFETSAGVAGSMYEKDDVSWVVPFATAQVSVPMERDLVLGKSNYRQVVKPRLMLGVVGKHPFDDVPLYDSARTGLNASEIYEVNSFVGGDRFEDTNLVVYGLETRLWHTPSDREVFSALVAQRYRLENSEITDGLLAAPVSGPSNLIAEGALRPTDKTAIKARVEWDPELTELEQLDLAFQLLETGGNAYSLRYERNTLEGTGEDETQMGLSLVRNLSHNWKLAADVNFDLKGDGVSELFGGLSYVSACRCWGIDIYAERDEIALGDRTTYFFQIKLEGLGGFGSDKLGNVISGIREPI